MEMAEDLCQWQALLSAILTAVWTLVFRGCQAQTPLLSLIFVVPSIMLYSSEISPTRCNNCVFILRNDFTLHVSGDNLTHHQEYICCICPQVSRPT